MKETKDIKSAPETSQAAVKPAAVPEIESINFTRLLQENLKRDEEILKTVKEIKKYIHRLRLWSILRFSLIIIPIILGFIYLPPFIKGIVSSINSFYTDLNLR